MKPLKPIDYRLISELLRDSNRSDRQIAKALRVSQPTVTRRRSLLEKDCIEGYTAVPKFGKIGFELAAFTFMKCKSECKAKETKDTMLKTFREWFMKQPNAVLVQEVQGMGWDQVCVSVHTSYHDCAKFTRTLEGDLAGLLVGSESFLMDLSQEAEIKPFHLRYLAEQKPKVEKTKV